MSGEGGEKKVKKKGWQPKRADWRAGANIDDDAKHKAERMAELESITSDVKAKERAEGPEKGSIAPHLTPLCQA